MAEKRYQKDETLEALVQATHDRFADSESISESEMLQLAEDLGIDRDRLSQVLRRGTGSVRAWNDEIKGWGWFGDLVYERKIDGELSARELEDLGDLTGRPSDPQFSKLVREFGDNVRRARAEFSVRDGVTRILVRSERASVRPFHFPPLFAVPLLILSGFMLVSSSFQMKAFIDGLVAIALLYYFGMQILMRRSEDRIREKVDRITEAARQAIIERPTSAPTPLSSERESVVEHRA